MCTSPQSGAATWRGEEVSISDPQAAIDLGIATMYQELDVVDGLSIAENIFLGHEVSQGGFTKRGEAASAPRAARALGAASSRRTSWSVTISAANRQIVSMLLPCRGIQLMIMDEPSAVLDTEEVEDLFKVVNELTSQGIAIVYITHRLEVAPSATASPSSRTGRAWPAASPPPTPPSTGAHRLL